MRETPMPTRTLNPGEAARVGDATEIVALPDREEIERLTNVQALEARSRELAVSVATIRAACSTVEQAENLRRDVHALIAVFQAKRAKVPELEAEDRRTESWIGKLLGKAKRTGRPPRDEGEKSSLDDDFPPIHDQHKYEWRLMAEHEAVVEELLAEGKTARKPIIRRIKEIVGAKAREEAKVKLPKHAFHVCSCADLVRHVKPGSVDVVITDPPYPKEYLGTYTELAEFAEFALKPGGLCVALAGQTYLPDVLTRLGERLTYHWLGCYLMPGGQSSGNRGRGVNVTRSAAAVQSETDATSRMTPQVAIIPPALREQYLRDIGESWFCSWTDLFSEHPRPGDCAGLAEITLGKATICRKCAEDLAQNLQSAVSLINAGDVSGWLT